MDDLLEDFQRLNSLAVANISTSNLEIMLTRLTREAGLGIHIGKLDRGRCVCVISRDYLLERSDGFARIPALDITVGDSRKLGYRVFNQTGGGVQVAERVDCGEISRIRLDDLLIYGDRSADVALKHVLFGHAQSLRLVE